MQSYKTRWLALTEHVRNNKPENISVSEYCKLIKDCREGDYLIKVSKNSEWGGLGCDYVQFDYGLHSSLAFGRRSGAAWFTKDEASEFIKNLKGFTIVKLSKNKK